jgi:hypothetical protein
MMNPSQFSAEDGPSEHPVSESGNFEPTSKEKAALFPWPQEEDRLCRKTGTASNQQEKGTCIKCNNTRQRYWFRLENSSRLWGMRTWLARRVSI